MSFLRILPVGLLLVTALGVTGTAQAQVGGSVPSLMARLHGQANVVEAQIQSGYRGSSHYFQLKRAADVVHDQIDELQSHLRNGAQAYQLRRDTMQVSQAINQLDQLVDHVQDEVRLGRTRLAVNPAILQQRVHQMGDLTQDLLNQFPVQTFRPGFGGGFGGGGFNGGGFGMNPQPGFQIGGGNGGFYIGGRNWGIQFGR